MATISKSNELRLFLETGHRKAARVKAQLLASVASVFFSQAQGDQGMAQMTQRQLNALFFKWLKIALEKWGRQVSAHLHSRNWRMRRGSP